MINQEFNLGEIFGYDMPKRILFKFLGGETPISILKIK
jgi:hypothetical protein